MLLLPLHLISAGASHVGVGEAIEHTNSSPYASYVAFFCRFACINTAFTSRRTNFLMSALSSDSTPR
jgi:hypothetical protein